MIRTEGSIARVGGSRVRGGRDVGLDGGSTCVRGAPISLPDSLQPSPPADAWRPGRQGWRRGGGPAAPWRWGATVKGKGDREGREQNTSASWGGGNTAGLHEVRGGRRGETADMEERPPRSSQVGPSTSPAPRDDSAFTWAFDMSLSFPSARGRREQLCPSIRAALKRGSKGGGSRNGGKEEVSAW